MYRSNVIHHGYMCNNNYCVNSDEDGGTHHTAESLSPSPSHDDTSVIRLTL